MSRRRVQEDLGRPVVDRGGMGAAAAPHPPYTVRYRYGNLTATEYEIPLKNKVPKEEAAAGIIYYCSSKGGSKFVVLKSHTHRSPRAMLPST